MTTTAPAPGPQTGLSHRQILVILSGLMLGMLLAALDQTIVATALPTIVGDLGGLNHLSWVVTAYLLTSTASTPLYGKLSDLFGRKRLFQAAIVIFLIGSVLAGMAQGMNQLIAFRAIQGIGAGGLMAMAFAIIGDIMSPRERGRYQGYMGGVFAVASIAGPLAGGFFADHLSWRWVFYINVPLGILALAVTSVVLKIPFRRQEHRIDYLGAALLVATVSTLLLVTVWGGTEYAWGSSTIIGLGVAGVVLLALFLAQERRTPEPILPLRLFRNRIATVSYAASFIVGCAMFGAIVFIPLYLQVVNGASPTESGLQMVPLMLGVIASSVVTGRLISRHGRYRIYPIFGTATMTFGIWLLSHLDVNTSRPVSFAFMVVIGIGMGAVMQVLVLAVQNAVDYRDLGSATSAATFFRSMGGAFGVAIFGSIFNSRLALNLAAAIPGVSFDPASLRGGPEQLAALPPAVRARVVEAFAASLHTVFLWAIPVAFLAFLVVLFLEDRPLRDASHVGAGAGEPVAA